MLQKAYDTLVPDSRDVLKELGNQISSNPFGSAQDSLDKQMAYAQEYQRIMEAFGEVLNEAIRRFEECCRRFRQALCGNVNGT